MSTQWDSFNSRLLTTLNKKWHGLFYVKFLEAIKNFSEKKDLNQMALSLFPKSEREVDLPKHQAIKNFGTGNVGRDNEVLMFLDRAVNQAIQGVLNKDVQNVSTGIQELFSSLRIPLEPLLNAIEKPPEYSAVQDLFLHPTLRRYSVLLAILMAIPSFSQNKQPLYISLENTEDLAFFGCLSLIDALFIKQDGFYTKTPFTAVSKQPSSQKNLNYMGIDPAILEEIYEESKATYSSASIQELIAINKGLYALGEPKLKLQEILPEVLNSSSFLWEGDVFDIDAEEVESMTEEERLLTLIDKKSAILERCFDHLKNKVTWHGSHLFMSLDRKNALMGQGRRVLELLDARDSKRAPLERWSQRERELKNNFLSLAKERGVPERKAAQKLLQLVSEKTPPLIDAEGSNALLMRILREYQNALIEKAKIQEEITEIGQTLQKERNKLEEKFYAIMRNAQQNYLEEFTDEAELLKVYATFSFILLNKDLFPPVSLKKETQKKAAQKIAALKEKWKKKAAFQSMKEKPTDPETLLSQDNIFQEIINKQVERVYRAYRPQTASYKVKTLTEEDLEKLSLAAKNIQEEALHGKTDAAKQFLKLEAILEKLLIEEHAFLQALDRSERVNPKRAVALQAYIESVLLFAGDQNSLPLTGLSNTEGFQKLLSTIVESLTDKGIKEKIEKSNQSLLKQAEELTLPVREETLQHVISKDLIGHSYESIKNDKLQLIPIHQSDSDRIRKLKQAYITLKDYFNYQIYGENYRFLQTYTSPEIFFQKLPKKEKKHLFDTRDLLLVDPFRKLPKDVKKWLMEQSPPTTERELFEAVQRFFQENEKDFKIAPLKTKKQGLLHTSIQKVRELVFVPVVANLIQDEIQRERIKREKYEIVTNSNPFDIDRQIDVFSNQTLFQFFDKKKERSTEDEKRANGVYYDFLPIFISSFLTTENLFKSAEKSLRQAKMQFIEQMPGAQLIYDELEEWMMQNQKGIKKLHEWLEEETAKNLELLKDDPVAMSAFMEKIFKEGQKLFSDWVTEPIGGYLAGMKQWALLSTVLSGGMLITFAKLGIFTVAGIGGFVPLIIGTVLLSCVGAAFLQQGALPFLKTLLNTIWEGINSLLGTGDYGEGAPSEFLLKTLETAFSNELTSFHKFEEMQHRLNYSFYIQELFEVLSHSQNNLLSFREKINALIPNATKEANFSIMALNMFCMLNKNLFLIIPSDLLQDVKNPHFLQSIEEYLDVYKLMFAGKSIASLKNQAREGKLLFFFAPFSSVGKFFGYKDVEFKLSPDQIVSPKEINPKQITSNIKAFLQTTEKLLEKRYRFEHELRNVLQKSDIAFKQPLNPKNEQQALALISCFEIVRYSFSLSKGWENSNRCDIETEFSKWLKATEDSPSAIFSSHLFNIALSSLRKTAEFASSLDIPDGISLLRLVKEISAIQKEFLENGNFIYPAFSIWEEMKQSLFHLLKSQLSLHPMIAYPILVEFDANKGLFLPLIVWNGFKQALSNTYGEDSVEIVPLLNASKILYLTNMEEMVLFSSPETRGFALSPFMVESMQSVIRGFENQELTQFLGRLSSRMQELSGAESAPLRYRLPFMRPLNQKALQQEGDPQRNAYPMIQSDQSYIQPNRASNRLNPKVGLAPMEYDPDNIGLSPEDAYRHYGNRLPEGIRNQIRSKIEEQRPQGMPFQSSNTSTQNISSPEQNISSNQNLPGLMPYMLPNPNMENPIEEQQNMNIAENPIQIGVDSEGKSVSMGSGGQNVPYDESGAFNRMWPDLESGNRRIEEMNQGRSFPDPPNRPYFNPMNQQYNPEIPESTFPWGKAAAIGGGAALGAGLLGYLMSDKNKKKEGKR